MRNPVTVAIVGGGIAGLAAGLALARTGYEVRILEQAPELREVGAGLQLAPNALKALDWLGVMPALTPTLLYPDRIEIRNGCGGAMLNTLPLGGMAARHGAGYALVHRADLLAALLETARTYSALRLETDMRVEAVERFDRPILRLGSGETVEADALVGADGLNSAVRRALLGEHLPNARGETVWRALIPAGDAPAAPKDAVCLWLVPGGHVVHYPLRAGTLLNLVAVSAQGEDSPEMRGPLHPALTSILSAPDAWLRWQAVDRDPAPVWGKGATTLVGDAAHPGLPYLAQGAAMALEDAVVLGQSLAAESDPRAAFRRFETARRQRTAAVVRTARRQGRIDHLALPWSFARDLVIRTLTAGLLQHRLDWIYAWRP